MKASQSQHRQGAYNEIRQLVAQIGRGESRSGLTCPLCRGGQSAETSLSIYPRDSSSEYGFLCHRASCSYGGYVRSSGSPAPAPGRSNFVPRVYDSPTCLVDRVGMSILESLYSLQAVEIDRAGWLMDIETRRLVCPVRSPLGVQRGMELRHIGISERWLGPKTASFKAVDDVWLGWFYLEPSSTDRDRSAVVVVEDVISAAKASRHYRSCSLMGSNLDYARLEEIVKVAKGAPICLALDRDATQKANTYAKKFRLYAPNLKVLTLSKDMKYLSDEEIIRIVEDCVGTKDHSNTIAEPGELGEGKGSNRI